MNVLRRLLVIPTLILFFAAEGAGQACPGDCDGSGQVTVDEILRAVNIALGAGETADCRNADANGDSLVTVDEIVNAVTNALGGCPSSGVCGGPITSTPVICNIALVPDPARLSEPISVVFSLSDLEGDIVQLCGGFGPLGSTPELECFAFEPGPGILDGDVTFGPLGTPPAGDYVGRLQVLDAAGNASNIGSANFSVIPD